MGEEDEEKKTDKETEESIAGGILKGIGKIIPGLGSLIESSGKSSAFKERLKGIDEEVERKIKEAPLRRTGGRGQGIPMGIPPSVGSKVSRRERFVKERPAGKPEGPPPMPKEKPADIFDEKDYIKVVAEIPGVGESDIKVDLVKDNLAISVDVPDRKYHQKLKLACEPKGALEKSYKNGVLEVKIKKG